MLLILFLIESAFPDMEALINALPADAVVKVAVLFGPI